MNSHETEILGEVPSHGTAYFCVSEPVGATAYRVVITSADWTYTTGD